MICQPLPEDDDSRLRDFPLLFRPGWAAQGELTLPARPDWFSVLWLRAGSLALSVEGQVVTIAAGDLLCLGAASADWRARAHGLQADLLGFAPSLLGQTLSVCRLNDPAAIWSSQELLDKWPLQPFLAPQGVCAIPLAPPSDLRASRILDELVALYPCTEHPFWRCLCRTAVLELLFLATRTLLDRDGAARPGLVDVAEDKLVAAVLLELRADLSHRPTLAELARKFAVNRSALAQRFKAATGTTIGAWLGEQRLALAERLVRETGLPLAEVGERVGWPDPTHFLRCFKRRFGMSPRAWRNRPQ